MCEHIEKYNLKESVLEGIKGYVDNLLKWSGKHNLISGKFTEEDVWNLVFDSIHGASLFNVKNRTYDAGSGAGFPGVIMAICYPEKSFFLVDSDRKKCSFLRFIKSVLNLKNVEILNCRIEKLNNLKHVVSKAAFSTRNLGPLAQALGEGGGLVLWTTGGGAQDLAEAGKKMGLMTEKILPYKLEGDPKERAILQMVKTS